LQETESSDYAVRTRLNVAESDGTVVLGYGALAGGTGLTVQIARELGKPCLVVDLEGGPAPDAVRQWLRVNRIREMNVAGPRESKAPGIHAAAFLFLRRCLEG
jgi:hypothetical protein